MGMALTVWMLESKLTVNLVSDVTLEASQLLALVLGNFHMVKPDIIGQAAQDFMATTTTMSQSQFISGSMHQGGYSGLGVLY